MAVDGKGPVRILVLVSGSGTNLQALIDAEKAGRFRCADGGGVITAVISDRADAYALERAKAAGIPALTEKPDRTLAVTARRRELSDRILAIAEAQDIGLIILAGFLSILEGEIVRRYAGRIINLHPALLPKFGGQGMYGEKVHQAVLASGETESGCTVHLVDAGTDTGPILLQRRVAILRGPEVQDTPETLAERIHQEEHIAIVEGTVMMIKRIGGIS
ncbi:phosphoribosylglycinamide formyltransferase [Spirochaetia bacterium]|nr:phosphoribosylglycinamide formyltransferase [Spirochaetia bacterium]